MSRPFDAAKVFVLRPEQMVVIARDLVGRFIAFGAYVPDGTEGSSIRGQVVSLVRSNVGSLCE